MKFFYTSEKSLFKVWRTKAYSAVIFLVVMGMNIGLTRYIAIYMPAKYLCQIRIDAFDKIIFVYLFCVVLYVTDIFRYI